MTIHILTKNGFKETSDLDEIIDYLISEIQISDGTQKLRIEKLLYKALGEKLK